MDATERQRVTGGNEQGDDGGGNTGRESGAAAAPGHAAAAEKAGWGALFEGANAAYTLMVLMGVVMHALQILVVVSIMPTVVTEVGGGAYYVWASMLYQVGSIVGAASVGPVWARTGGRGAFMLAGGIFALGTLGCALSRDMMELILARGLQGYGGGLIIGGTMGFVSRVFAPNLRTRILAMYQGFWSVCSLFGPFVGGAFAEIGWWRGTFWSFLPFIAVFLAVAWWSVPKNLSQAGRDAAFPFARIMLLALGILGVAESGQMNSVAGRTVLIAAAVACIAVVFILDARASQRMFPSRPLSLATPLGMGNWLLVIIGVAQAAVTVLLPLVLQVVHEVTPLLVGITSLINSCCWTTGTFIVAGFTGARERFVLRAGTGMMLLAVIGFLIAIHMGSLTLLLVTCACWGLGMGIHHVHLGARVMDSARKGEETVTASSSTMIRSIGQASGTAIAGMVANIAGLGLVIDAASVTQAINAVFLCSLVPVTFAICLMWRFSARVVPLGKPA